MAAADSGVKPLQNAMKMAKLAIQLDGGDKHKEAYCEYLRTINYISHVLLEEAGPQKEKEMVVAVEEERMLRLAEQCLERAKSFVGKNADPPDLPASASSTGSPGLTEPHHTAVPPTAGAANTALLSHSPAGDPPVEPKAANPTRTGHRRVLSEGGGELSPFLPPEVFHRLQTVALQDMSKKQLTPIEEASRMNQKLRANYEARLARLSPGQAYQKTSLTLSLQRQMMENLIIAKAREDALQRKMEERRLRLQEEANRRFAASGEMTAEEQEQRVLYTNVLEYEQDHGWPKQWKANLKENPDVTLVSDLISYLLSRSDHPVVKLLRKHQYRIYNRLYPIVSKGLPQSPPLPLRPSRSIHNLLRPETQSKPIKIAGSNVVGQSLGTNPSLSPSPSHELYDDEDAEEPHAQVSIDRENSFEDLEQFLTRLDWALPHGSTDGTGLDSELACDPSAQSEQGGGHVEELEMRAVKEHLKAIVKDIHIAIDQLLSLCLLSFECLNTASWKDLCLASIEEAFFTPLWSALVALFRFLIDQHVAVLLFLCQPLPSLYFRKVHREREQSFEAVMTLYRDVSPGDVGVPFKLFPPEPGSLEGSYPYESAVQELHLLIQDCCPQRKLECIVRTLRLICACAENYRCLHESDSSPKTAAIGADDLLPILSFVALRCQCPQLVSECAALEEFIHEGYLIGEEGYCLTSMQSALAYIESLHPGGAQLPAEKLM